MGHGVQPGVDEGISRECNELVLTILVHYVSARPELPNTMEHELKTLGDAHQSQGASY